MRLSTLLLRLPPLRGGCERPRQDTSSHVASDQLARSQGDGGRARHRASRPAGCRWSSRSYSSMIVIRVSSSRSAGSTSSFERLGVSVACLRPRVSVGAGGRRSCRRCRGCGQRGRRPDRRHAGISDHSLSPVSPNRRGFAARTPSRSRPKGPNRPDQQGFPTSRHNMDTQYHSMRIRQQPDEGFLPGFAPAPPA